MTRLILVIRLNITNYMRSKIFPPKLLVTLCKDIQKVLNSLDTPVKNKRASIFSFYQSL